MQQGGFSLKRKWLFVPLSALLLLASCGQKADAPEKTKDKNAKTEKVTKSRTYTKDEVDMADQKVGDTVKADGGTRKIVGQVKDINETLTSGPLEVTLNHAQISDFTPSEELIDVFGGDDLVLISFDITVKNTENALMSFYPDQATAVTDDGHQVTAETLFSDDVGGDFYGGVTKEGQVFFIYAGQAKDVNDVRYIIGAPHDEEFDTLGEDIEFNVKFK